MKRIVWRYGLASGAVLAVMTAVMVPLCMNGVIDFSVSEVVGYSSMVVAFLVVFFGIKAYRDEVAGGAIGFGKAVGVGLLMTLITCAVYVIGWEIVYYGFFPDFMEQYSTLKLQRMEAAGETAAAIEAARAEMAKFAELYKNPLVNVAITFLEVFPVGLVVTLVSAAILRRRTPPAATAAAVAA